jgi:hypothetical protein
MANRYTRRPDGTTGTIPHGLVITVPYLAASVDEWVFIADADYEVVSVRHLARVAGSNGSAVTADIMKTGTDTTAPASGTSVMAAADSIDLKATADTLASPAVSTTRATRRITTGDRLGINYTGTLTAAVGLITINLKRIQSANADR